MIMCTFGILSCLGWKAAELICDLCYSCSLLQHNGPGERKKRSEPSNNKTNIQLYSMWLWLWLWMLNACGTSILMEQRINCRFISHPFRVMVSVRWKCWLAVEKWPTQILSCTAFGDCNQTVCVCVCARLAFSIQIMWLLLVFCLTYFISRNNKPDEKGDGKKVWRSLDETRQKGCDLSLNHCIVHAVINTRKICSKLIRYGNLFVSFDACFVWMQREKRQFLVKKAQD